MRRWSPVLVLVLGVATSALAQGRVEAGGHVIIARVAHLDATDIGAGARIAWRPSGLWGIEAEVNAFPSAFPNDRSPVSSSRVEALAGVTLGPRLGRVRPFARLRPGVLRYAAAPGPVVCIAIFPPPLSCQLAAGKHLFVVEVGGGVEVGTGRRTVVRIDAGDRVVRHPQPAPTGHDVRVGIGWAVRF